MDRRLSVRFGRDSGPVSYTHLDVYKRQIQNWAAAGADFTRFAACHNYYPKPYTGLSLDRVKAVSYTHLDVYKRQTLGIVLARVHLKCFWNFLCGCSSMVEH